MKILIADDEPIVLDSIRQVLKSEADLALETAGTGREAIEKAEIFRPELVIMDIKMPGINGLEALAEIHRQNPQAILVILSAYENFAYAQEAIRLEVSDYLLKPINKPRIMETISKAQRQLAEIKAVRQDELILREKYKKLLPAIANEFVHNLMSGVIDESRLREYQELLGVIFDAGFFMAISYRNDPTVKYENEIEYEYTFRQKMADLAEEIHHLFPCLVGPIKTNPLLVLVPIAHNPDTVVQSQEYFSQKIMTHFQSKLSPVQVRIGTGNIYPSGPELRRSYQEAILALDHPSLLPVNHYRDLPIQPESDWETAIEREFQEIYEGVKFGNVKKTAALLDNASPRYCTLKDTEHDRLLFYLLEFLITAYRIARESSRNDHSFFPSFQKTAAIFTENSDLAVIFNEVAKRIIHLTEIVKEGRDTQIKSIIRQAKSIIDQRFQEHLSLEELARLVNTSPFYFSRLFREELGMNYIDYVTNRRLEKAGSLLAKGLSVKECCFAVGYNDPNYFSRIFRKHYGMTPTEFREEHLSKQGR
jgi:two-component system response regulator YesN